MDGDFGLIVAPLAAGLLVLATHVPFGQRVLARGIIFIDLSVAQVAALGVVLATRFGLVEVGAWATQVSATVAALLAAGLLSWTERIAPQLQEALIGCLYVIAASAAVLVLAGDPHGAEQLHQLLAGQILWVTGDMHWPIAVLTAVVLPLWFLWGHTRTIAFYVLFALCVTASVQLVGVFLVFASLILPALAGVGLGAKRGLLLGWALGAAAYGLGLWGSLQTDWPAGPLIVCLLAALALLRPGWRWLDLRRQAARSG